ncbi:MAG: hypothetical protein ABL858_03180, partial [Candidatus Nitrotoga sp.]
GLTQLLFDGGKTIYEIKSRTFINQAAQFSVMKFLDKITKHANNKFDQCIQEMAKYQQNSYCWLASHCAAGTFSCWNVSSKGGIR